jgi:hypothetical protein
MIELKRRVNQLIAERNQPPAYDLSFTDEATHRGER